MYAGATLACSQRSAHMHVSPSDVLSSTDLKLVKGHISSCTLRGQTCILATCQSVMTAGYIQGSTSQNQLA